MGKPNSSVAEQIAKAGWTFEQRRTGHGAQWVAVNLYDNMLFITLRSALSPVEQILARTPSGAVEVQEFHRELFAGSAEMLHKEIHRITGVQVNEAAVMIFTSGAVVLALLLANGVPADNWSGMFPASTDQ